MSVSLIGLHIEQILTFIGVFETNKVYIKLSQSNIFEVPGKSLEIESGVVLLIQNFRVVLST